MVFTPSTDPDLTEGIPFLLSSRATSQQILSSGSLNGISVGGIAFLLAGQNATDRGNFGRATIPIQKDQVDTSKEPGEQSFTGFWLRSQTSWHSGQGVKFYEPTSDPDTEFRYEVGMGVDPWTEGQVTLLKVGQQQKSQAGSSYVASVVDSSGADWLVYASGSNLTKLSSGGTATNYTTANAPATRVAVAGTTLLFGHAAGVDKVDLTGSSSSTLWTQASGTVVVPYWVKQRIVATRGADLLELPLAGGAITGTQILYTHPDANWTWTSVTEGPNSVLASGYSGGTGVVYRFTLQDAGSGQTPKLSQAYPIAEFPTGETPRAIKVYLGKYVGIGTNKGLRVGVMASDSSSLDTFVMGPLLFNTTNPVQALEFRDTFLYAGVSSGLPDGTSGLARVNLKEPIGNGLTFPYSWDAQWHTTGVVNSVATFGASDRMAGCVVGGGVYVQSATDFETTGYVTSGRIRYSTVQPKAFMTVDLTADIPGGSVVIETIEPSGSARTAATLTNATGSASGIGTGRSADKLEFMQVRLTLARGTATQSPAIQTLQVYALPVPSPQRRFVYPLLVFDTLSDQYGSQFGYQGFAYDRVQALEHLEENVTVVGVTDYTCNETYSAVIESVELRRTTAPEGGQPSFGGILSLTMRKVS